MNLLEFFLLLAPDEDEPEDEPIVVQPQDEPIKNNKKLDPPPSLP